MSPVFSALLNVPRWFQFETEYVRDGGPHTSRLVFGHGSVGTSDVFRIGYLQVGHSIFLVLGLCAVMVLLNTRLIKTVKQRKLLRSAMRVKKDKSAELTDMLVVVALIFLACNVLTIVDQDHAICGRWLYYGTAIADVYTRFNSSVNFVRI